MKYLSHALVALSLVALPPSLDAQRLDRSPTGLVNPTVTFDFNSMAIGSMPGTINGVDFGSQFTVGGPGACGGAFPTPAAFNNGCSRIDFATPLIIRFSVPTTGVAFNLFTNSGSAVAST